MKKISFNKILAIVFSLLSVITILLIFLNATSKPHIRNIEVEGGNAQAEFYDSKIKIYFNTPILRTENNKPIDFKNYISFEPSTEFNSTWSGNTLFLIPKATLLEDTDYKITINPGIKDIYGNSIDSTFSQNFKTKPLTITYLQKNYPKSKDKIIKRNLKSSNEEVLFEEENIKEYSLNKDYLIVSNTLSDKTNNVQILDLQTKFKKDLGFKNTNISRIDISKNINVFIYIYQDVKPADPIPQPLSTNNIKIYDLTTSKVTDFNPNNTASDVMDANFSPDGRSILYRTSDSSYFLATVDSTDNPIAVGRYIGTGGFNKDGTKVLFVNYDPLQTYSSFPFIVIFTSDRKTIQITDGQTYTVDPIFSNTTDDIILGLRYKDLLGAQGLFKVSEVSPGLYENTFVFKDVYTETNYSLELPKPSWDDRYILAEKYDQAALLDYQNQRNFINQRKPNKANLIIFDRKENKVISEIPNAFDGEWEK